MKRALSLLLVFSMLLAFCACGADLPQNIPENNNNSEQSESVGDQNVEDPLPEPPADDDTSDTPPDEEATQPPSETGEPPVDPPEEEEPQEPEEYIRTIDPYAPMVALTFDDGPHEEFTAQILDVLEQYHAVATFFEVGYNARHYPDLLCRMAELGCEIASHTNSHYDLTTLSRDAMLTDLAKLDQIIYDATGMMPTLVRPPYGATNSMVRYESGRAMILWTVDTQDWRYRDAQTLIDYLQNYGDLDGEVVLMHSIHGSTAEAMATVVPWLIEQGYQLVTVSELMAYYYGVLLEANKCYDQTWFVRHGRTEYPLELPAEPMQTMIPEYTTVPVVPNPPKEDPPEQNEEGDVPAEDPGGEEVSGENEEPPTEPTPPTDESELPPEFDDDGSDEEQTGEDGEDTLPPDNEEDVPPEDEGDELPEDDGSQPPEDEWDDFPEV